MIIILRVHLPINKLFFFGKLMFFIFNYFINFFLPLHVSAREIEWSEIKEKTCLQGEDLTEVKKN